MSRRERDKEGEERGERGRGGNAVNSRLFASDGFNVERHPTTPLQRITVSTRMVGARQAQQARPMAHTAVVVVGTLFEAVGSSRGKTHVFVNFGFALPFLLFPLPWRCFCWRCHRAGCSLFFRHRAYRSTQEQWTTLRPLITSVNVIKKKPQKMAAAGCCFSKRNLDCLTAAGSLKRGGDGAQG